MTTHLTTYTTIGLTGVRVGVEVDIQAGIPGFAVIGLADPQIQELRERVRSAITNSGYVVPARRIVVNLTPSFVRKNAPALDLPVALAVIAADGSGTPLSMRDDLHQFAAVGELALDGSLRSVTGVLPVAEAAAAAGVKYLIVPEQNAKEAALADITVLPAATLADAAGFLVSDVEHTITPHRPATQEVDALPQAGQPDMADIKGFADAKRALVIAAAGRHSILLIGAAGTGKTMLARRLPGILPPLNDGEALEVTRIQSVVGLLPCDSGLVDRRPFRAPHYTISLPGLLGGGRGPLPGEVSIAHTGVLMLDEVPAFSPGAVEAVMQTVRAGQSIVCRGDITCSFPADTVVVATAPPCPCGQAPTRAPGSCRCSDTSYGARYRDRLSALARLFDMVVYLTRDDIAQTTATATGEDQLSSAEYRADSTNARRTPPTSKLSAVDLGLHGYSDGDLSLLRVARTIADIYDVDEISDEHLAEARNYTTTR